MEPMTVSRLRFLDIVPWVRRNVEDSIERLGDGGLEILNLVIAKPNIPADIARNYKQVLWRCKVVQYCAVGCCVVEYCPVVGCEVEYCAVAYCSVDCSGEGAVD